MLQAFDAPNGDFACVRRPRSNTPLQALTLLNEPLFLEAARALALTTLKDGGTSDADRLDYAFRRCLGRRPESDEAATLLSLLTRQHDRYVRGELNAWDIAVDRPEDALRLPPTATPAQLGSWTVLARVLLNLDETITRE